MDFTSLPTNELIWVGIGFFGQSLFFSRWLLQWFVSEKKSESQIPVSFWYMSLVGSAIVLAYAIHKNDPVFIAGQSVGTVVYIRNLILIHRAKERVKSG
ncbi:MAG: lipid-A-disaccharide synthase N-terminal domain-containing protein [Nitrospirota bacterium]|nr:lipid-A-disaccharide synthase N-terminal domain-containing protein [Nitrospirota bacterium]MDH5774833.1 lipid-A-disaccharide synthase N-terminal domain-containing protein [Nitrospirota bacterium]